MVRTYFVDLRPELTSMYSFVNLSGRPPPYYPWEGLGPGLLVTSDLLRSLGRFSFDVPLNVNSPWMKHRSCDVCTQEYCFIKYIPLVP